jgi:hypothetical protein
MPCGLALQVPAGAAMLYVTVVPYTAYPATVASRSTAKFLVPPNVAG